MLLSPHPSVTTQPRGGAHSPVAAIEPHAVLKISDTARPGVLERQFPCPTLEYLLATHVPRALHRAPILARRPGVEDHIPEPRQGWRSSTHHGQSQCEVVEELHGEA